MIKSNLHLIGIYLVYAISLFFLARKSIRIVLKKDLRAETKKDIHSGIITLYIILTGLVPFIFKYYFMR